MPSQINHRALLGGQRARLYKTLILRIVSTGLLCGSLFLVAGCGSSPQAESSDPSVQTIRGDSDRFFQKMEKEEAAHEKKP